MPIRHTKRDLPPTPTPDGPDSTYSPAPEPIEVTDIELSFRNGLSYTVTIHPGSTIVENDELITITSHTGEVTDIYKRELLFKSTRKRTILKKPDLWKPEPTN